MDKEQFYKEFFRYLECGSCADLEFCQKQLEPACKTGAAIYRKLKMEDLEKENEQLKQQCKECKHINKKIELNIKNKLMNEIQQLKQQLAEKEKERHEEWLTGKEWKWECDRLKREQNQTAIAELNNILDTFAIFVNEEKESLVSLDGSGNLSLLEYIENRIDTLKGESK